MPGNARPTRPVGVVASAIAFPRVLRDTPNHRAPPTPPDVLPREGRWKTAVGDLPSGSGQKSKSGAFTTCGTALNAVARWSAQILTLPGLRIGVQRLSWQSAPPSGVALSFVRARLHAAALATSVFHGPVRVGTLDESGHWKQAREILGAPSSYPQSPCWERARSSRRFAQQQRLRCRAGTWRGPSLNAFGESRKCACASRCPEPAWSFPSRSAAIRHR